MVVVAVVAIVAVVPVVVAFAVAFFGDPPCPRRDCRWTVP